MPLAPEQFKFLNAAAQGDAELVRALLAGGVDVNTADNRSLPRNRTALMHAAEKGHYEVVEALLAAGAKVDAKDRGFGVALPGGNTALLLALKNKHPRIARRLLDARANPNVTSGGVTVFGLAAGLGDLSLIRQLLDLGLDPNKSVSKRADLPLASALFARQTEAVRLLVASGANPNATGARGVRPLEIAVREGLTEAVKLLLHRGANPKSVSENGFTPLMTAVLGGHRDIVKVLLERDANVNACNKQGQTALDIAQQMLSDRTDGRAPAAAEISGATPPLTASGAQDIIDLLREAKARTRDQLPRESRRSPAGPASRENKPKAAPLGVADFLELLRYDEPEFSVIAVQAPLEKTARAFCDFRNVSEWKRDVPRQLAARLRQVRASAVTLVKVRGNPWTLIYRSVFRLGADDMKLALEDATELSARLKTKALAFVREQTAQAVGYDFFERGKQLEHAQWMEQSLFCWFKSRFSRKPGKDELGEDFTDRVFRQQGIYLPACFPQIKKDEAWICLEKASFKAVQRADIMIVKRRKTARKAVGDADA